MYPFDNVQVPSFSSSPKFYISPTKQSSSLTIHPFQCRKMPIPCCNCTPRFPIGGYQLRQFQMHFVNPFQYISSPVTHCFVQDRDSKYGISFVQPVKGHKVQPSHSSLA
mmetsp:Transcript_8696/g.13378  ORF Transcript_8696/g.13378 Transcript_8696/m.13378 type:complete len:109 (-) Transcript_8696:29-355(-)